MLTKKRRLEKKHSLKSRSTSIDEVFTQSGRCLNCGADAPETYCAHCGQKATTKRLSVKHFFIHDILHGLWHFDKGILRLMKNLLLRPGPAARDYIAGKRMGTYNVFLFLLILVGLNFFLHRYGKSFEAKQPAEAETIPDFVGQARKIFAFAIIPFFALNASIFFRRSKFNFAEHLVIGAYAVAAPALVNLILHLLHLAERGASIHLGSTFQNIFDFGAYAYTLAVYYTLFRPDYQLAGFAWRMTLFYILFVLQFFGAVVLYLYLTGNQSILL